MLLLVDTDEVTRDFACIGDDYNGYDYKAATELATQPACVELEVNSELVTNRTGVRNVDGFSSLAKGGRRYGGGFLAMDGIPGSIPVAQGDDGSVYPVISKREPWTTVKENGIVSLNIDWTALPPPLSSVARPSITASPPTPIRQLT